MSEHLELRLTTPGDRDIVMAREFRAPRHRVFDAYTQPALLRRWFGPHGYSLVVCDIDFRVDGHWRYVVRGPDGSEMTLQGIYQEIARPDLLVTTETFDEGEYIADNASMVTTTFVEHAVGTTVTTSVHYPTAELRDEMARSGMAEGVSQGYDRLADILAEIPD